MISSIILFLIGKPKLVIKYFATLYYAVCAIYYCGSARKANMSPAFIVIFSLRDEFFFVSFFLYPFYFWYKFCASHAAATLVTLTICILAASLLFISKAH